MGFILKYSVLLTKYCGVYIMEGEMVGAYAMHR